MSNRKADRWKNGTWERIEIKQVEKGYIVRMVEENGTLDPHTENGITATENAKKINGEWCFEADFSPVDLEEPC